MTLIAGEVKRFDPYRWVYVELRDYGSGSFHRWIQLECTGAAIGQA